MEQNKIEILNKIIEKKDIKIDELTKQLSKSNEEIETLKNKLFIKENFISEQEVKLYELMAITEKKIQEFDESRKAMELAKLNYKNGLIAIKKKLKRIKR